MPLTQATLPPDRLLHPVGRLMRAGYGVEASASLSTAAQALRDAEANVLLITENGRYLGVLSERELAAALANGASSADAVGPHASARGTFAPDALGAEALRALAGAGVGEAAVVDPDGRPLGLLSASGLFGVREAAPPLPQVGGMATPLGVYLTTGGVSAGVPKWALMLTGGAMFAMIALGRLTEIGVRSLLREPVPLALDVVLGLVPLALFVALFRLTPLAGIHAAEHMAVNAIERGEPLVPEVVARMPRAHPRCGTNIAVAASLFLAISQTPWIPLADVRLIVALLAVLFLWRPLGTWAQLYVTTRPPNARQIASGIRAAEGLLARYTESGRVSPSIPARLWNSGLLQVMGGSLLMYGLIYGVGVLLGHNMDAF